MKAVLNDIIFRMLQVEDCRYYYLIGGRWSGKSWGVIDIATINQLKNAGLRIGAFRKVYGSLKNSVFDDWTKILANRYNLELGTHYNRTVSPLYIKYSNGSDIVFKGMDDPEKSKGLSQCHWAIMEELNEFELMDFETIDNGLRGEQYPHKIFMMHNPVPRIPGSSWWFEKMFGTHDLPPGEIVTFDLPAGRCCACKTTYLDNAWCPEAQKKKLESYKETNPDLYRLWTLGEYAELQGVIFQYDLVKKVPENIDFLGYGLDFGFSNDPAALVGVWANSSDIWVKGFIYSTGLTNKDLYDKMSLTGVKQYDQIIADSAEPKSIQDLYNFGFHNISGVKKRSGYKEDMVNVLKSYKIHLVEGDIDLQREFSTWSWQKDKTGKDLPKVQDGNDHYIDAFIMLAHERIGESQFFSVARW